jgi:hypothetical protein
VSFGLAFRLPAEGWRKFGSNCHAVGAFGLAVMQPLAATACLFIAEYSTSSNSRVNHRSGSAVLVPALPAMAMHAWLRFSASLILFFVDRQTRVDKRRDDGPLRIFRALLYAVHCAFARFLSYQKRERSCITNTYNASSRFGGWLSEQMQ